jgi:glycerol uptake facilitator protein
MKIYLAEVIGTMIMIILGDGVVANCLLNRSKGQNSGWMVITTAWGVGMIIAIFASDGSAERT